MTDFLQLPSLKVTDVRDEEDAYAVDAHGRLDWITCPLCTKGRLYGHGTQLQTFQDTPSHGKPVRIVVHRRRYRCITCGKTMFEPISDLDGKRLAAGRLIKYLRTHCFRETFASLSRQVDLDEKTIRHVFDDYVEELETQIRFRTPRILGIDELKIIGAYRAVVTNIECKTLFDIRPSPAKADLVPYFRTLRGKDSIEWVTMDMYHVYRQVVRATLPQARIVVDRFHIARMANEALKKLRKQVRKGLTVRQRLKLKDERFLLLKRQHDLTNDEMQRALVWFGQFPLLGEAHALKEGFLSIWDQRTRSGAEVAYQAWLGNIAPKLAPVLKDLTTALRNWHEEIFAYFEQPITNAYTESVNNLTRAMNRMGRGYSFEVIRARMLYNSKALKDGSAVEIIEVNADIPSEMGFVTTQMLSRPARKKKVQRVVYYGPSIITLAKLLEEGQFE